MNKLLPIFVLSFFILSANTYGLDKSGILSAKTQAALKLDNTKKITIIDFFASWCVSCRVEIPILGKLNKQIDKSKIEILGVDVDEDVKLREKFLADMRAKGMDFRVVNDQSQAIISEFGPVGMPALYYVINGKVVGARIGAIDHIDQVITADLKQLGVK